MKVSELINELSQWPMEAEVELAIPVDLDSEEPMMEDKVWLKIDMVEEPNVDPRDYNMHCLIFGGKVMMG